MTQALIRPSTEADLAAVTAMPMRASSGRSRPIGGSIGVHRTLGFAPAGTIEAAGRKFDRWLDVGIMQRSLGFGAATAPP